MIEQNIKRLLNYYRNGNAEDAPVLFEDDGLAYMSCGRATYMLCVKNADADIYGKYCAEIAALGLTRSAYREERGNLFSTFEGEGEYIYAYYTACNGQIRAIVGPTESLLARERYADSEDKTQACLAFIPQPSDGNGYIIRLPDRRFLVFDGGYWGEDRVYKALRQLESGKIVIAAWFISHPHGDHYPAFIDFIRDHYGDDDVKIECLVHNYVHHGLYNITGSAGVENNGRDVELLYDSLAQYAHDLPIIKAHTGQILELGCARAEILYTIEDLVPQRIRNINNTSMVVRAELCGHKIMMLGDTCYDSAPLMIDMWGDYLRSDIMQIAHHGIWPSIKELYPTVIFPNASTPPSVS